MTCRCFEEHSRLNSDLLPICNSGGAKNSVFYTKRYASRSGLNSSALDFLPISNIEEAELDPVVGGLVGAVPIGKIRRWFSLL